MTTEGLIRFELNDRVVHEVNVKAYEGVMVSDSMVISLDGVVLNDDKDGLSQLETRIRKNLTTIGRIVGDQFIKAKASNDPNYTLLKLAPIGPDDINSMMGKVDTMNIQETLPLIAMTLTEYEDLITQRNHDALLRVVTTVIGDKAKLGIDIAKKLLSDPNIATPRILDQLYMSINNVHKLAKKYYKCTIVSN